MKKAALIIIILVAVALIPRAIAYNMTNNKTVDKPVEKSVFQYSKAEYVDHAVKTCTAEGNPEAYCRCFYTKYLENHTVTEVLKFDTDAAANPDTFEPTQEQLQLASKCLE